MPTPACCWNPNQSMRVDESSASVNKSLVRPGSFFISLHPPTKRDRKSLFSATLLLSDDALRMAVPSRCDKRDHNAHGNGFDLVSYLWTGSSDIITRSHHKHKMIKWIPSSANKDMPPTKRSTTCLFLSQTIPCRHSLRTPITNAYHGTG